MASIMILELQKDQGGQRWRGFLFPLQGVTDSLPAHHNMGRAAVVRNGTRLRSFHIAR